MSLGLLGLIAGLVAACALLVAALDWHPVAGYVRSAAYHRRWRVNPVEWRYGLAIVEFALFVGPPLMVAFGAAVGGALVRAGRAARAGLGNGAWQDGVDAPFALAVVTAAVMVAITGSFGAPEAARLWLFMLPWVCCAVASGFAEAAQRRAFAALLVTQIGLAFFVKNYLVW